MIYDKKKGLRRNSFFSRNSKEFFIQMLVQWSIVYCLCISTSVIAFKLTDSDQQLNNVLVSSRVKQGLFGKKEKSIYKYGHSKKPETFTTFEHFVGVHQRIDIRNSIFIRIVFLDMKDISMSLTRSRIKTPRPKTGRTRRIKNEQVSR